MKAQQIVLGPLVTERSMQLRDDENKYAFRVHLRATKPEIRKAVEELFEVRVVSLATMNALGNRKRLGRSEGYRSNWKTLGLAAPDLLAGHVHLEHAALARQQRHLPELLGEAAEQLLREPRGARQETAARAVPDADARPPAHSFAITRSA